MSDQTAGDAPAIRVGKQILVFRGSSISSGPRCVAGSAERRCRTYVLAGSGFSRSECFVPGVDGAVPIIEIGRMEPERVLRQLCRDHFEQLPTEALEPTWERFDPATHRHLFATVYPLWTSDGIRDRPLAEPCDYLGSSVLIPSIPPSGVAESPPSPTLLYRYFDADGRLVYVGITGDLASRERSHFQKATWPQFAVRCTTVRYPSWGEAEAAEYEAIKAEHPLFNIAHNDSPDAVRRLVEYLVGHGRTDLLAPAVSHG